MGIFWDLLQQDELDKQEKQAKSTEERVLRLEDELKSTRLLLRKTLLALEKHLDEDIDNDGSVG